MYVVFSYVHWYRKLHTLCIVTPDDSRVSVLLASNAQCSVKHHACVIGGSAILKCTEVDCSVYDLHYEHSWIGRQLYTAESSLFNCESYALLGSWIPLAFALLA